MTVSLLERRQPVGISLQPNPMCLALLLLYPRNVIGKRRVTLDLFYLIKYRTRELVDPFGRAPKVYRKCILRAVAA